MLNAVRGAWAEYRVNRGQELVIGGYTPSPHGLDTIIVGYYKGDDLIYVARVRNALVPASRRRILERLRPQFSRLAQCDLRCSPRAALGK
jgi:ATP-dependent DNA ligase